MYDLIIIGGGPGGYHLAENAAHKKLKVAIIEANKFGGTCLNVGCIPSKAFLHIEKVVLDANESMEIGVVGKPLKIDQKKVIEYKNKKVDFLVKGTEAGVRKSGAKIFKGRGEILTSDIKGEFKVQIDKGEILTGKNLVIATGSEPFLPPIDGLKKQYKIGTVITSTEALSLVEIPKELIVIGAGVIGLELGSYYSTAGSKVTIIEAGSKIAGATDPEITILFQRALEQKGIKFVLNAMVNKVEEKKVTYIDQDKKETIISYDKVLVAVGRKANTEGIGLENIGVHYDRTGIVVDEHLKTNIPGVYGVGDVNGKLMLAHTAFAEADIALSNILGDNKSINYNKIPVVIYGAPEISEIGITELRAKEEGIKVRVKKLSMLFSGRFVIENAPYSGLIKVIIHDKTEEIIGMSIFGNYASEIIIAGSILVGRRFSINQVRDIVFAHPTVGEVIKDVILS